MYRSDCSVSEQHSWHDDAAATCKASITSGSSAIWMCTTWTTRESAREYGHPGETCIELLEDGIDAQRASPVTAKAATAAKRFTNRTITEAIYATAWDGTVKVEAHLDGRIEVVQ